MPSVDVAPVEDGQFDDAPGDSTPPAVDVRAQAEHPFIDDENILEWSSGSEDEEDELDEYEVEENNMEAAAFYDLRAEDEDWEIAERGACDWSH